MYLSLGVPSHVTSTTLLLISVRSSFMVVAVAMKIILKHFESVHKGAQVCVLCVHVCILCVGSCTCVRMCVCVHV